MNRKALPEALDTFITRMPKVETHLHLEGSIQPATLLRIARRNGVHIPAHDEAGVAQLFRYQHFHDFLGVFMVLAKVLVRGEDFELIAYELGHHLADQQVRYAEVMISPSQYYNRGMDLDEVVQGAAAGFARAQAERGTQVCLAFDYGRQFGTAHAWPLVEVAIRNRKHSLVAWSIGGDELHYPPEPFAEVFAAARRGGLHLMAHAGEVVGPASVWGAARTLGAERLGHGIRSVGDPALLEYLRAQHVVLDVCPSSNLLTGAVARIEDHPLRMLFDAGVPVTINTDDPTFFATTLCDEYRLAASAFGFSAGELATTVRTAAGATFLPAEERRQLVERVSHELDALQHELGLG